MFINAKIIFKLIRIGKSTITKGDKNILQDNSIICSFQHDFTNTSIEDILKQRQITDNKKRR
jgi:hypothetical protein